MKAHAHEFSVEKMAKLLKVSKSGYYAYLNRPPSTRAQENEAILKEIEAIYHEHKGVYGSPRIKKCLERKGIRCSRKRVAKLMKKEGLRAKTSKKKPLYKKFKGQVSPNLIKRDFEAEVPNEKWVSDITYIFTKEGTLYLATVMDLFSKKILAYSLDERMKAELVETALKKAYLRRGAPKGVIHHSDRGSQYASHSFKELCLKLGIKQSMNSGSCYDNAAQESFFHSLKTEMVYLEDFKTKREAKMKIFEYIEGFYNRKRLHSTLGYLSGQFN